VATGRERRAGPLKSQRGERAEAPSAGSTCVLRVHPHLLRHAYGTYALEATGDLRLVRELLGHKDVATTQRHTKVSTNRMRQGIQQTADYVKQL
jgi:site-specific recombinase XerD